MKTNENKTITGNNRKVKFFGSVLTAGLLMFGTASFAQERDNVTNTEVDEFNQYDTNADQQWDRNEFDTRMEEDRTFETWDTNRDNTLTEDEFNEGTKSWREQNSQQNGTSDALDGTTEGVMDNQEGARNNTGQTGNTGIVNPDRVGSFNDLDTDQDSAINRDEFNEGVYNNFDSNQDRALDSNEYNEGLNSPGTGTELNQNQGIENNNGLNNGTGTETGTGTGTDLDQGTGTGTGY